MTKKRAVCLNCMDGRAQIPAIHWIKENCGVDHVDMITEAGMDGYLAENKNLIKDIIKKINLSVEKNNAVVMVIVGHHDCKGNPVGDEEHKKNVKTSVERMEKEVSGLDIIGLWINDQWEGEQL